MKRLPILVTGAHRSGSTWAGRMLCAGGEALYIHEPFNNVRPDGPMWVPKSFPNWFHYLTGDGDEYGPLLDNVVAMRYPLLPALASIRSVRHLGHALRDWALSLEARLRGKRPLIKDPIALFSADWLARRFNLQVIVLVRHPAAFTSSLKRLDWWFKFSNWLEQDRLMRDLLPQYQEPIRKYLAGPKDLVEQAILMWNCMYSAAEHFRKDHPDWIFLRQEQLAADPVGEFQALYRQCGLTWNAQAERIILSHSSSENVRAASPNRPTMIKRDSRATIRSWEKGLDENEVLRIREGTRAISDRYYGEEYW